MGTRFLLTRESPLHPEVKARMLAAAETDTTLVGRRFGDSIRVLKSRTAVEAIALEAQPATTHGDLLPLIGAPRWMQAMESGDADDGALPVGQCVGLIDDLPSCAELVGRTLSQARDAIEQRLSPLLLAAEAGP